MAKGDFTFSPLTLGQLLKRGQLRVPPNQRSYAWREKQVRYLLQDFNESIYEQEADDYFLGTVVIVEGGGLPSIVDGQQRIATTSILLARVRDLLFEQGRDRSGQSIDQSYLENIDIHTEESVSRIQMNEENQMFYNEGIMKRGFAGRASNLRKSAPRQSNRRMLEASVLIESYLRDGMKQVPSDRQVEYLLRWEKFINERARVLSVFVSDEFAAYRMFETLNDRGLRASQVDILKNYLYSRCQTKLDLAKDLWKQIDTMIEPLGGRGSSDEDDGQDDDEKSSDPMLNFFRHFWVTREGPTKAKVLAERMRSNLTNETRVLRFLDEAAEAAKTYVAIAKHDDMKWRDYPPSVRQDIETLNSHLRVNQIRPLIFAVSHYFEPAEAAKALQLCVSWSVRFLIAGGRGGMLDTQYSRRAGDIGTGKLTKARDLREAMKPYVPSNQEFEQAFAVARVSRPWLARYLIRAIEKKQKQLPCPEYVPSSDTRDVNLEHVLPLNPGKGWNIDVDIAEASYNLLGNQALISAHKNMQMGNESFEHKKPILAESGYTTTNQIAEYENWTRDEILDRQVKLAAWASETWPLQFGTSTRG